MYTPPGMPRSRSFTRLTIRVALEHFGQSVLLLVSMTFLRSPVLAIFAIMLLLPGTNVSARALDVLKGCGLCGRAKSNHPQLLVKIIRDLSAAGIGGEELRLRLSEDFTRRTPQGIGGDKGCPMSGGAVEDVEGVAGWLAVGNCTLFELPEGADSPGLRSVGGAVWPFSLSPSAC